MKIPRPIDTALAWAKERHWDQSELARRLNVSPAVITNWKTRGLPPERWPEVAAVFGRSVDELISVQPAKTAPVRVDLKDNPEFPVVRRVRFKLSAGASGFGVEYLQDDDGPIVFRADWLKARGFKVQKLFAVRIANRSMEPTLWDGDTVVVNTDDTEPRDGDVYAFNFEGELVVKRLVRDAGQWWLVSDNQDQRRFPRKAADEHCHIIGRIVHRQSERL